MFCGNKVAWNRQLVYSGQHVARMWLGATDISYDTLCDVLPATSVALL